MPVLALIDYLIAAGKFLWVGNFTLQAEREEERRREGRKREYGCWVIVSSCQHLAS